jgi:hypothetical protein
MPIQASELQILFAENASANATASAKVIAVTGMPVKQIGLPRRAPKQIQDALEINLKGNT